MVSSQPPPRKRKRQADAGSTEPATRQPKLELEKDTCARPAKESIKELLARTSIQGKDDTSFIECHSEAVDGEAENPDPIPGFPVFDPQIRQLISQQSNLVSSLRQKLKSNPSASKYIELVAEKSASLEVCVAPERPLVMLHGESGTGKSYTINCLTDIRNLMKSGAIGRSCTCVPIVLTHQLTDQNMAFAATIHFFDHDACRELLREQLSRYYMFKSEPDEESTPEEETELRDQASTAMRILQTLFNDKPQFSSLSEGEAYLKDTQDQKPEAVLDSLMGWCAELFRSVSGSAPDGSLSFEEGTARELNSKINPYIFETLRFSSPSLWPLVKCVCIGIPSCTILKHVNLVDLPGTTDTNKLRAKIATSFTQECDALWIVTSITRTISDPTVERIVATYGERFGNNLAIIATSSDLAVNDVLADDMESNGEDVANYWKFGKTLEDLDTKILKLQTQSQKTNGSHGSVGRDLQVLRGERQITANAQLEALVCARNAFVTRCLQQEKKHHLPKNMEIPVFCISNTHYQTDGALAFQEGGRMSRNVTGIPALRSHAISIAAPRRFERLKTHACEVNAMFQGLAVWTECTLENRQSMMHKIHEPMHSSAKLASDFYKDAIALADTKLFDPIDSNMRDITKAALDALSDIDSGWPKSTTRAFVRKDGNHKTVKMPRRIWNEEFTAKQTENIINPKWRDFELQLENFLKEAAGRIASQIGEILSQVDCKAALGCLPERLLRPMLTSFQILIHSSAMNRTLDLQKRLSNIKVNATHDISSAYFGMAMLQTYVQCKQIKGHQATSRMLEILRNALQRGGDASPFTLAKCSMRSELEETLMVVATALQFDVERAVTDMSTTCKSIVDDVLHNGKDSPIRLRLKPFVTQSSQKAKALFQKLNDIGEKYSASKPKIC